VEISLGAEVRPSATTRADLLQAHLCAREEEHLALPADPQALHRELRRYLLSASDDGLLRTKANEVFERLKLSRSPLGPPPEYAGIFGGEKDLKRTGERPYFLREDGA
jgi:hypothetical protein